MNVAKARDRQSSLQNSARSDVSTFVREAALATGWIRLDTAVVSSRGRFHAINEDWYSVLDGACPLFVVADGVSSGAMASCASRELVGVFTRRSSGDASTPTRIRALFSTPIAR